MQGQGFTELLNNYSKCCVSADPSLCKMSWVSTVDVVDLAQCKLKLYGQNSVHLEGLLQDKKTIEHKPYLFPPLVFARHP